MKRVAVAVGVVLAAGAAYGQFGREAVWMTAGSNAQRTSWVRSDGQITKDSLGQDFQLLWKVQLEKRKFSTLSEPILMERYIGYRGFRTLAFVASDTNSVYAVDTDLNRMEWQKHLEASGQANCPGSMSASVTLATGLDFPTGLTAGGGAGRGTAAKSGVGEPLQGAVTLASMLQPANPAAAARPNPVQQVRPKRGPIVLYNLAGDGALHSLYVSNGEEPEPPIKFVPPDANARGLIVANQVAYAVAAKGCSEPTELFALHLDSKEISEWSADAPIAGSEGPAIGPTGTIYVATGKSGSQYASSVIALNGATMKPKDWYTVPGQEFVTTPVLFQYKSKTFAAAVTGDGVIHVLNASSLGGQDHLTPLAKLGASTGSGSNRVGFAMWQDVALTHWLLVSSVSMGTVSAWKVVDDAQGAPVLEAGWVSPKIESPTTPLIINGVAFVASNSGKKAPSVLYGLDPTTGKVLWTSKDNIGSPVSGVSAGAGHVYVTTHDGALYAFGFPMEH